MTETQKLLSACAIRERQEADKIDAYATTYEKWAAEARVRANRMRARADEFDRAAQTLQTPARAA